MPQSVCVVDTMETANNNGGGGGAGSSSSSSRKRCGKQYTDETETLDRITKESEARLVARRQARVEARQLRHRELEQQQQQQQAPDEECCADTINNNSSSSTYASPVSSSQYRTTTAAAAAAAAAAGTPSLASGGTVVSSPAAANVDSSSHHLATSGSASANLRQMQHELMKLEDKLRDTLLNSAQLDNEKSTLIYQLQLCKDQLAELQEDHVQLQREHKTRCSDHEQLRRVCARFKQDLAFCEKQLQERDLLIANHGLVLVGGEETIASGDEDDDSTEHSAPSRPQQKALVSHSAAALLSSVGEGTLECRLRRLAEEKEELEDQLRRLQMQLEEERHLASNLRSSLAGRDNSDNSGGDSQLKDGAKIQREVSRQMTDFKYKLQKSQEEIADLNSTVQRLENQVYRYKKATETAERAEEELKQERRKLQRELRDSQNTVEELETSNCHLQRRLDKLKSARSSLLKDLSE